MTCFSPKAKAQQKELYDNHESSYDDMLKSQSDELLVSLLTSEKVSDFSKRRISKHMREIERVSV